jgi:DNA polymerase
MRDTGSRDAVPQVRVLEGGSGVGTLLEKGCGSPELLRIRDELGDCTRCKLARGRTHLVYGVGNPRAELVFAGEGPGEEEDRQGEPFVGRAGQLLTKMIEAMGFGREDVYIANVVKCRPPDNRDPKPVEIATCRPYLAAQIDLIRPTVVVTLGNFATKLLLDTDQGITKLRGAAYPFGDAHLVPTYHPAAALRSGGMVVAQMRADLIRAKELLGWAA